MKYLMFSSALLLSPLSSASEPVITGFGNFYNVPEHVTISDSTTFKIAFDVDKAAKEGEQNNAMNSLARFINMHIAHGVKPENIQLALVVHGSASVDVLANSEYKKRFKTDNKNHCVVSK